MGYCIRMSDSKFCIKKENCDGALQAAKQLGNGSNHPQARGSTYENGKTTKRFFSWMNDVDVTQWAHIKNAMDEWRYPCKIDSDGNVVKIEFDGEKIGQEEILFNAIAPFVESGSYIEMTGEDGAKWRWVFDGKTCDEKQAKVSYE